MAKLLCVAVSVLRGHLGMYLQDRTPNVERQHCIGLNGGAFSRGCSPPDPVSVHVYAARGSRSVNGGGRCIRLRWDEG